MAAKTSISGSSVVYNAHVHIIGWMGPTIHDSNSSFASHLPSPFPHTTSSSSGSRSTTSPLSKKNKTIPHSDSSEKVVPDCDEVSNTSRMHPHRSVHAHEYLFAHLTHRCPLLEQAQIAMSASCVVTPNRNESGIVLPFLTTEKNSDTALMTTSSETSSLLRTALPSSSSSSLTPFHTSTLSDELLGVDERGSEGRKGEDKDEELEDEDTCSLRTVLDYMLLSPLNSDTQKMDGMASSDLDELGRKKKSPFGGRFSNATFEYICSTTRLEKDLLYYPFSIVPFVIIEKQLREEYAKEQAQRARMLYAKLIPLSVFPEAKAPPSLPEKNRDLMYFDIIVTMDRPSFEYIVQYYSHQKSKLINTGVENQKERVTSDGFSYFPSSSSPQSSASAIGVKRGREPLETEETITSLQKEKKSSCNNSGTISTKSHFFPSPFCRKPILVVYPSAGDSRLLRNESSPISTNNHGGGGVTANTLAAGVVARGDGHGWAHSLPNVYSPPPLSDKAVAQCSHAVQQFLELLLVKSHIQEAKKSALLFPADDGERQHQEVTSLPHVMEQFATVFDGSKTLAKPEEVKTMTTLHEDGEEKGSEKKGNEKLIENERNCFFNTNWRDDMERVLSFFSPIMSVDFTVALV